VGLLVFGVIEILIGVFSALLVPLMVLSMVATRALGGPGASPQLRSVVPNVVILCVVAVSLVWLGIGSIRARRWARRLMLVLSWLWLITGVAATVVSMWMLPAVWSQLVAMSDLPPQSLLYIQLTTWLALCFLNVGLPAAFLLFYRSPHVAATCRALDPGPSWVDDCPSHILSLALIYAGGAVSVFVTPAYNFALPLFGVVLNGATGAVAWAVILGLLTGLAWGTCRRDIRAWWVGLAAAVFGTCATTVNVAMVPFAVTLERMELPPTERALMEGLGLLGPTGLALLSLVVWGTFLAYLLYVKRFFVQSAGPDPAR
jgi:hypothetical protein